MKRVFSATSTHSLHWHRLDIIHHSAFVKKHNDMLCPIYTGVSTIRRSTKPTQLGP